MNPCPAHTCQYDSEVFCFSQGRCTCDSAIARFPEVHPDDLVIIAVEYVPVTSLGYNVYRLPLSIPVKQGDIIGWIGRDGAALSSRPIKPGEFGHINFTDFSTSVAIGSAMDKTFLKGRTNSVHLARAIVNKPTTYVFCHTYQTTGTVEVSVNVSNDLLSRWNVSKTFIEVSEGINATILTHPEYAATGETVTFTVLPHTGRPK